MFHFPTSPILCTYFTLGNCQDLNISKIYTKSWKFHKEMRFWLQISICQSSMVHECCCINCPIRVGNFEASTVCWRWIQLSGYQAAADCIRRVAVEYFVVSQEDKPKRHQSAHEISRETAILRSNVHSIIHCDLQLNCFKRRCAQLLSEASSISRITHW